MPLVLSDHQRQALVAKNGPPLQFIDEETGKFYYLISAEQYATVQSMMTDEEFAPRDAYPLIAKTASEAGWHDPAMDVYDQYDEHRAKPLP